jgi:diaminopimelate decarboxylase
VTRQTINVSGVHSGSNPSPGLGTALSLRSAFPEARIVAIDYSTMSTGLHHPVFDEVLVCASWKHIDFDEHERMVASRLAEPNALWLSGLDVEAAWLAQRGLGPRVLVCPPATFAAVAKPSVGVAKALGIAVPESTWVGGPEPTDFSFIESYGWPVWVKGPRYEAFAAHGWAQLDAAAAALQAAWGAGALVQRHVEGREESIAFAAVEGHLTGAVAMRKLATTAEGKTWAGEVRPVDDARLSRLTSFVQRVGWHGGGELEMVRSTADDQLFLIDVNPRFPAWVHGATAEGAANLPASLVDPTRSQRPRRRRFVRVVTEIEVRPELPLQLPALGGGRQPGAVGKHPSGMPELSRRLADEDVVATPLLPVSQRLAGQLADLCAKAASSPCSALDVPAASQAMQEAADCARRAGLRLAYSVKTNPDPRLLQAAHDAGWLAETITGLEIDAAMGTGWAAEEIVLNGPAKRWPATDGSLPWRAVFFDSLSEMQASAGHFSAARVVGVRVRPMLARSRFGIDLRDGAALRAAAGHLGALPMSQRLGVHMHFASSTIGTVRWEQEVQSTIHLAVALGELAGRPVRTLDLGGGFTPYGLQQLLDGPAERLVAAILRELPEVDEMLLEPGKAVVAPHGHVVATTLLIDGANAIVDASIAELSDFVSLDRPVFTLRDGVWWQLPPGPGCILGRSCIEEDVVARGVETRWLEEGQRLVFGSAGAYDQSMRYSFATGGAWETAQ